MDEHHSCETKEEIKYFIKEIKPETSSSAADHNTLDLNHKIKVEIPETKPTLNNFFFIEDKNHVKVQLQQNLSVACNESSAVNYFGDDVNTLDLPACKLESFDEEKDACIAALRSIVSKSTRSDCEPRECKLSIIDTPSTTVSKCTGKFSTPDNNSSQGEIPYKRSSRNIKTTKKTRTARSKPPKASKKVKVESKTKQWTCLKCGEIFQFKRSLISHIKVSGHMPFSCCKCGSGFLNASSLRKHAATHDKRYKCDTCGLSFTTKTHITRHMTIHLGIRPSKCQVCGREFRLKSNLEQHMLVHTHDKPYICQHCGKMFRRLWHLTSHQLTHIPHTERPHKCTVCRKGFATKQSLSQHMNVHDISRHHICDVCNQRFFQKKMLEIHINRYHCELSTVFTCNLCGKAYLSLKSLKQHLGSHLGNRKVCTICDKEFLSPHNLCSHMKSHHRHCKKYTCEFCGNVLSYKNSYVRHVRTLHSSRGR